MEDKQSDFLTVLRWVILIPVAMAAQVGIQFFFSFAAQNSPVIKYLADHGFVAFCVSCYVYFLVTALVVPRYKVVTVLILSCWPVFVVVDTLAQPKIEFPDIAGSAAVLIVPLLCAVYLLVRWITKHRQKQKEAQPQALVDSDIVSVVEGRSDGKLRNSLYFAIWTPAQILVTLTILSILDSFVPWIVKPFVLLAVAAMSLRVSNYRERYAPKAELLTLATPILNLYAWAIFYLALFAHIRFSDPLAATITPSCYWLSPFLLMHDVSKWPGAEKRRRSAYIFLGVIALPIFMAGGCKSTLNSIAPENLESIQIGVHSLEKSWYAGLNGNGWQELRQKKTIVPGVDYIRVIAAAPKVEVKEIDKDTVSVVLGLNDAPAQNMTVSLKSWR